MDRHLRFISSVIAKQGLWLLLVVAVVVAQAWWIYQRVRAGAVEQAGRRQMMLAEQTARGIETYYAGIVETLDLLRRAEDDQPFSQPEWRERLFPGPRRGERRPPLVLPPGLAPGLAQQVLLPVFWDQLQDRVSQLFIVDRRSMRVIYGYADPGTQPPETILEHRGQWIVNVEQPSVSKAGELGGRWGNLVVVPLPGDRRVVCAVVPIEKVARHFLVALNDDEHGIAPLLVDESGRVLYFRDPNLLGKSLVEDASDPRMRKMIIESLSGGRAVTQIHDDSNSNNPGLGQVLVSAHPVEIAGGHWWVVITASMKEVDALVRDLYRRVLVFATVAIGLFTLVFVRIGVGQVRERARLERVRHELLQRELEQARGIQLAWLPGADNTLEGAAIHAVNKPANHISGDFYNWFDLPDGRSVVLVGDVTGHGMSAAFLMATTQLLTRAAIQRLGDPARAMTHVNRELCQQTFSGQFVTMMILLLDPVRGQMQAVSAGHPPAVMLLDGKASVLPVDSQLVMGIEPDCIYTSTTVPLHSGVTILLYTDGVIEAPSEDGRRFDLEGLLRCLDGGATEPHEMVKCVLSAVDRFRGSKDLPDDLTIVAIRLDEVDSVVNAPAGVL